MSKVKCTKKNSYWILTIVSSKPYNKVDDGTLAEIVAWLGEAESDETCRALIIHGYDHFAVGADVAELLKKSKTELLNDQRRKNWQQIAKFKKPFIAAVSGYALGAGNEMVLLADIVIAAKTAKFGQPEINLGLIPGAGGTQRLVRVVGKPTALFMLMTGKLLTAKEALAHGLISEITEVELILERAEQIAQEICERSPIAIQAIKHVVNAAFEHNLSAGMDEEYRNYCDLMDNEERNEGIQAFLEKRKPNYFKK